MTRKHKPTTTTAAKKRPAADARKSVKAAAAEKSVAAAATVREKERAKPAAAAARKVHEEPLVPTQVIEEAVTLEVPAASTAEPVRAAADRPVDGKSAGAKNAAEKKPSLGIERRPTVMPEDRQSQLKLLIARGKEQGYLTYAQVNDHLPSEIVDPEQIEDIVNTINDMGIPVYEKAPDTESLLASEPSQPADEEAIEEAAAALAALDAELGRTTDPVRMYMREMGTVELLTREGEIRIAKRIEEGLDAVR